ncbi:MAG: GntR family transcriptional regulator [Thermodesulfobacteriota bacterium]|nr:GntR family transcriptional regulator [Thermodesulfobacteriota bacterium]
MPGSKNLVFHKAKKNRIFQDVVDLIQEAIFNNKLIPGDFLPPERELRETFNVSRGTLREALRILEHKGLIEIRLGTGGGSVVKHAGVEQLNESIAILIRSGDLSVQISANSEKAWKGELPGWLPKKRTAKILKGLNS